MTRDELKSYLRQAEGWRATLYPDSLGIPTIGYGRNMTKPISKAVGELMLEEDLREAENAVATMIPVSAKLDLVRRSVLVEMAFNMGITRLLEFKKMLFAVISEQWEVAAKEMLDSKWARQVGGRAKRLAEWMRSGDVGGSCRNFGRKLG